MNAEYDALNELIFLAALTKKEIAKHRENFDEDNLKDFIDHYLYKLKYDQNVEVKGSNVRKIIVIAKNRSFRDFP